MVGCATADAFARCKVHAPSPLAPLLTLPRPPLPASGRIRGDYEGRGFLLAPGGRQQMSVSPDSRPSLPSPLPTCSPASHPVSSLSSASSPFLSSLPALLSLIFLFPSFLWLFSCSFSLSPLSPHLLLAAPGPAFPSTQMPGEENGGGSREPPRWGSPGPQVQAAGPCPQALPPPSPPAGAYSVGGLQCRGLWGPVSWGSGTTGSHSARPQLRGAPGPHRSPAAASY